MPSWVEGMGPFHREAVFTNLRGIRRGDAGELCADVVDDVEVAVRSVVIPQANIGTDCLGVRCVHLNQASEGQETIERIISLQASQHY